MKCNSQVVLGMLLAAIATSASGAGTGVDKINARVIPDYQANSPWYTEGQSNVNRKVYKGIPKAKNIILFVGDGMGMSTVTAARILDGQLKGMDGEENNLSFDLFPYTGLAKTYNVDAQIPDSAGTMTAMMSGVKTDAGVIGVDEGIERGDCSSVAGNELITVLELSEIMGKSTGVVTTARITHATPAAAYSKSADRNWEDDSDMPREAINVGCEDIATQLVDFESNLKARFPSASNINGIEVMMGGGRRHFLPKDDAFNSPDAESEIEGDRTDGRNLIAEWKDQYPAGTYVFDQVGFDAIDKNASHVFGLFNESHMHYEADRNKDIAGEPSLTEMTIKAIEQLNDNRKGYFLMVESGRIDHGHHAGSAYNALTDTIEFSKAIQATVDSVDLDDTLIVVTADHSHVFTIAGYSKRGNPILGKSVAIGSDEPTLGLDGMPYTTLGYANGLGFRELSDETDGDAGNYLPEATGRQNLTAVDTEASGFHQEALVPLNSETHAGEDVVVYGIGPGAHMVSGTNEQSVIYHIMNQAGGLEKGAAKALMLPHEKHHKQNRKH